METNRQLTRVQTGTHPVVGATLPPIPQNTQQGTQLVINSFMRNRGDYPDETSFAISLPKPFSNVSSVNVVSVNIPKTSHMISDSNDAFYISEENVIFTVKLPWGTFSRQEIANQLERCIPFAMGSSVLLNTYQVMLRQDYLCIVATNNSPFQFSVHSPRAYRTTMGYDGIEVTSVSWQTGILTITTKCQSHGILTGDIITILDVTGEQGRKYYLSNVQITSADPAKNIIVASTNEWPFSSSFVVCTMGALRTFSMDRNIGPQLGFNRASVPGLNTKIIAWNPNGVVCQTPHFLSVNDRVAIRTSDVLGTYLVSAVIDDFTVNLNGLTNLSGMPYISKIGLNGVNAQDIGNDKVFLDGFKSSILLRCWLNGIAIGKVMTAHDSSRFLCRIQMEGNNDEIIYRHYKTGLDKPFELLQPIARLLQIKLELVNERTGELYQLNGPNWSIDLDLVCDEIGGL